ncbi:T9SS type A sorting domain-containing protein [bacterium]|nr:T9SS type A sorting domain-containing protein [bacterium]
MKNLLTVFVILLTSTIIFGQAGVSYTPTNPLPGDLITLTFDPSQNSQMPANSTSVILHWGINGFLLPSNTIWPAGSVSFQNGAALRSPMILNGSVWQIQIQTNSAVSEINFVFNDGTPTTTGTNWAHDLSVGPNANWKISLSGGFYPNVEWLPATVNPNDTLKIIIKNATQGGVIHWGVNAKGNNWTAPFPAYVPPLSTIVGIAIQTQLVLQPNGDYVATLKPFKLPNQVVETVDFAIKWQDGTWDNNNSQDYHIFLDFTPKSGDAVVNITNLQNGATIDTINQVVNLTASGHTTCQFWANGIMKTTFSGASPYSYNWVTQTQQVGEIQIVGYATNSAGRVTFDPKKVWKVPSFLVAPAPNVKLGATDNGNGTATFLLNAPGKAFVSLVGTFNSWDANAHVMNFDDVQGFWWKTIPLSAGTYQYQYKIEGTKSVGDPFSYDVEWKDAQGNETGDYSQAKTVFTMNATPFNWTDANFQRPPLSDLTIYELHTGDFSATKDFAGITAKLGYLDSLGITAIELMPPYEFPGGISWGYNPAFYLAPESSYGTPNDFKNLVNAAHSKGISVIVDLVFNHCDGSSPFYQIYGGDFATNPYLHAESNPWGFPDFDFTSEATKSMVVRTLKDWLDVYHVDGFRYDYTQGIGWQGYDIFGVSYFTKQLHDYDSTAYQICEHLPQETNLILQTEATSTWHDTFHDRLKAQLRQGAFEGSNYPNIGALAGAIHYATDGFQVFTEVVNYTESHDEQRIIYEAQTNPALNYVTAVKKSKLGAAILFTSAGIPMLYHGQEFGEETERTIDPNPLHWNKLTEPTGNDLHTYYKRLMWLRNNYSALRTNYLNTVSQSTTQNTIVYHRNAADGNFTIAANMTNLDQTINITTQNPGTWYEFITDTQVQTTGGNTINSYTIPASSARIFVSNKTWTSLEENKNLPLPTEFSLSQNYPNPFNPATKIEFSVPEKSFVKLSVYNTLGQTVKTLLSKEVNAGNYFLTWNGTNERGKQVASGIYFYRLEAGNLTKTNKMILLK